MEGEFEFLPRNRVRNVQLTQALNLPPPNPNIYINQIYSYLKAGAFPGPENEGIGRII